MMTMTNDIPFFDERKELLKKAESAIKYLESFYDDFYDFTKNNPNILCDCVERDDFSSDMTAVVRYLQSYIYWERDELDRDFE